MALAGLKGNFQANVWALEHLCESEGKQSKKSKNIHIASKIMWNQINMISQKDSVKCVKSLYLLIELAHNFKKLAQSSLRSQKVCYSNIILAKIMWK